MNIHDRIKLLRVSKNLTQHYMAEELNIDPANYGRIERGETQLTLDRLTKIARILGTNITTLLEENSNFNQTVVELLSEILSELKIINKK